MQAVYRHDRATSIIDEVKLSCPLVANLLFVAALSAQGPDTALYRGLRWRHVGPFRGGRTVGATGVVQQPNVFYIGVNNGGVWKTTDYGGTWAPIFHDQPTQSTGALPVASSDPDLVYGASRRGRQRPDLSVGG